MEGVAISPDNPRRRGHAPGHVREALHAYLDAGDRPLPADIVGQLWNCSDLLPSDYCVEIQIPRGSTYARAVRHLASTLHVAQR